MPNIVPAPDEFEVTRILAKECDIFSTFLLAVLDDCSSNRGQSDGCNPGECPHGTTCLLRPIVREMLESVSPENVMKAVQRNAVNRPTRPLVVWKLLNFDVVEFPVCAPSIVSDGQLTVVYDAVYHDRYKVGTDVWLTYEAAVEVAKGKRDRQVAKFKEFVDKLESLTWKK